MESRSNFRSEAQLFILFEACIDGGRKGKGRQNKIKDIYNGIRGLFSRELLHRFILFVITARHDMEERETKNKRYQSQEESGKVKNLEALETGKLKRNGCSGEGVIGERQRKWEKKLNVEEKESQERDREKWKELRKETSGFNGKTKTGWRWMRSPKERKEDIFYN